MTIPEYDQECDCDLCTALRNYRIKASKEKHAQRNHTFTSEDEFRCPQCGQFSEECECEEPTSLVKIMTPHIDVEYIITESKLVKLQKAFHKQSMIDFFDIINQVFDTPRGNVTSDRDIPDCPYHKYQCAWDGNPEEHYCKKDETVIKNIARIKQEERDAVLDKLDVYAEQCRCENEARGRIEKDEIIISALAGAALAFEGTRKKISVFRLAIKDGG